MTFTPDLSRQQAQLLISTCLAEAGVEQAHMEARLIMQHCTQSNAINLITHADAPLGDDYLYIQSMLARRLQHEPLSRIIGRKGFWSIDLALAPDVLDPRADSETVISASLALLKDRLHAPVQIADLGTGSGALLCALLHSLPHAQGIGIDQSAAACALAQKNLHALGLAQRGVIEHKGWDDLSGQYDLIISNPPYIRTADIDSLAPEVRNFDPRLALDGGADGLDAYRALIPILIRCLTSDGWVVLEIGAGQADDISNLLKNNGFYNISAYQDLAGHVRALSAGHPSAPIKHNK